MSAERWTIHLALEDPPAADNPLNAIVSGPRIGASDHVVEAVPAARLVEAEARLVAYEGERERSVMAYNRLEAERDGYQSMHATALEQCADAEADLERAREALERVAATAEDAASMQCTCTGYYRCLGCEREIAERAGEAGEVARASLAALAASSPTSTEVRDV